MFWIYQGEIYRLYIKWRQIELHQDTKKTFPGGVRASSLGIYLHIETRRQRELLLVSSIGKFSVYILTYRDQETKKPSLGGGYRQVVWV